MMAERENPFTKAKAAWGKAKGAERSTERYAPCPTCEAPMKCTRSYKGESYHFEGVCSADPEHNIERYGYVEV